MWAGFDEQRQAIKAAGLELAPGELLAAATGRGAQLEGITALLLLTGEDDFNALGSSVLQGSLEGPVYRLGARLPSHGVVAPDIGGEHLFAPQLTRYEVCRRYSGGARICTKAAGDGIPVGGELRFLVRADGRLDPVTQVGPPEPQTGDTMACSARPRAVRDAALSLGEPADLTERLPDRLAVAPGVITWRYAPEPRSCRWRCGPVRRARWHRQPRVQGPARARPRSRQGDLRRAGRCHADRSGRSRPQTAAC